MSDLNINEDAQSGGEFSGFQSQSSFDGASSSSQPIESAFPDEDEETITMLDVIERQDKLEEEASAVLGNSDEKNCTYPKGYISRQALYSCATCSEGSDKQAAICLACSLECHDNHEVYELYTKRNYRCDCGNSMFKPNFECKFMDKQQKKPSLNENNKYNHNFSGRYCTCDKKYPPDESDDSPESSDEMWQCIVCEDWYHTKHLEAKELPTRFDELICGQCVERLDFVHYYKNLEVQDDIKTSNDGEDEGKKDENKQCKNVETTCTTAGIQSDPNLEVSVESTKAGEQRIEGASSEGNDTNDSQEENKDPEHSASNLTSTSNGCILEELKKRYETNESQNSDSSILEKNKPLFWSDCQWRSKLCRCHKCMELYKTKNCEYLLDEKDTVQYYEAQGKALAKNSESPIERGMSALNRMNRAAVVEALHGYDELKADLSDYLRKFADTKKVVREEDIHEFFQQLKSKKKPRLDFSGH